jgi:hypothetical protein
MTHSKPGFFIITLALLATVLAHAADNPDFSGAWTSYRGTPSSDTPPAIPPLVLKAEAKAAADAYQALIEGTNHGPGNACVGYGMPESMLNAGGGYPMEIIQRPGHILVINELHNEIRRFYIGEEAGNPDDFFPERNGYSTASWAGNHLIVETTRLKTQVDTRYPHSNQATIREEYYLDNPLPDGTRILVGELVMEDPLWLEETYMATKKWRSLDDYHVLTYECTEPKWLDEMERLYREAGLDMIQE